MKVQAKLYGPVHDTFVLIAYASSEGLDGPAHLRSVTTAFAARTEKRRDVDEGSGPTLSLLWGWFCCCQFSLNIPPIELLGLIVLSLLSYALLGVLSSFAIILTRTRKLDVLL